MATGADDELARTATAPPGSSQPAVDVPLADTFGRFKLERELGVGGMGAVHAAFDPKLERRVALKVLRRAAYDDEASARLRREAVAMARLAHPNVVTIYEVDQVDGRDFIAMELVDGGTLADWLRERPRRPREIVAAFIAAGRGLAAAHAAGLVHRDFKPHNILRRRDGRIVVTDFGLARGVEVIDPAAATVDLKAPAQGTSTPSSLSGLTATGSVLGTPAYMAPEQWTGGVVGPAADQFGFCVALWEALTGERPFRGATLDELKAEVARGAGALDASKLPRRLRGPLLRGLDPDPKKRWPSMDALLDAIARGERRPTIALALASGGVVAAAALYVAIGHGGDRCEAPARDADAVWPADASRVFAAAGRGELAVAFDRDVAAWRAGRAEACTQPREHRAEQLACFDGVLARLDAVHRAVERLPGELARDAIVSMLVDPAVCARPSRPRLVVQPTDDLVAAFALLARASQHDDRPKAAEAAALANKPGLEPCARVLALLAVVRVGDEVGPRRAAMNDAATASEQCGDDRLRADVALELAPIVAEQPVIGPRGEEAIKRAEIAVQRVPQIDLVARLDMLRANALHEHDRPAEALAIFARALDEFAARGEVRQQIVAAIAIDEIRAELGTDADLAAMRASAARWRPIAEQLHDARLIHRLAIDDAYARYFSGDIAGGHADNVRLWRTRDRRDDPAEPTQRIAGTVVDRDDHPVAGATVVAGRGITADAIGIPFPFPFSSTRGLRETVSDATGHFVFDDAPTTGVIVAQLADRRSLPVAIAQSARLVVEPTRRIAGRVVTDASLLPGMVVVGVISGQQAFQLMVPVRRDGTFVLEGAPTAAFKIGAAISTGGEASHLEFKPIPAATTDMTGIELPMAKGGRALDVIVRSSVSTQLDAAQVLIFEGKLDMSQIGELIGRVNSGGVLSALAQPVSGERAPKGVLDKLRAGDLVAHFDAVGPGDRTACALGLNGDLGDSKFARQIETHINELKIKCEPIGADTAVVVVEAPPQKRFD